MKTSTIKEASVYIIGLLFVLLFVYAAVNKIIDFEHFGIQLGQSPLLSAFADYVAVGVPAIELFISLLLLIPRFRMTGLFMAFSLMVMFTAYIIIILNWSSFIPCSCGGILSELGWTEHLIFNVVFILLGLTGLVLQSSLEIQKTMWAASPKRLTIAVSASLLLSFLLVVGLFVLSEEEVHRNNSFLRRYPQHPVTRIGGHDLKYNSYYIAGFANGTIYLGNYKAPLHVIKIDTAMRHVRTEQLRVKHEDSAGIVSIQLRIDAPWFYLSDGIVPIIYKGKLENKTAEVYLAGKPPFAYLEPMGSDKFVTRSVDTKTNANIIGSIDRKGPMSLSYASQLLEKQSDGIFDTDGMLHYNKELEQIVYVYYYRNEYFTAGKGLNLLHRGRTIDTLRKAQIVLAHEDGGRIRKLAKQPTVVNIQSCTSGRYLFVNSDRLGKYEPEEMLDDASIIDVYDLVKQTYEFSFYLYKYKGEEIKTFKVYGNVLVGLSEHHVVTYRLLPKYFSRSLK